MVAAAVGFLIFGGMLDLWPLSITALVQSALLAVAVLRGVGRLSCTAVGTAEVAGGIAWSFIPRHGGPCCPPDLSGLPFGGDWSAAVSLCGLLTLGAAILGAGKRRDQRLPG